MFYASYFLMNYLNDSRNNLIAYTLLFSPFYNANFMQTGGPGRSQNQMSLI